MLLVLILVFVAGCQSEGKTRLESAQEYLNSRTDVSQEIKDAILKGRVLIGMYPDEAYYAAGHFVYEITGQPEGVFPPDVIFSQRQNPDPNIVITLRFNNTSQFESKYSVPFKVVFRKGRATEIVKNEDEEESLDDLPHCKSNLEMEVLDRISHVYHPQKGIGADPEQVIPKLINLLENQMKQEQASVALGRVGKPAVPSLIRALSHRDFMVRQYASNALASIGKEAGGAIPALRNLLKSESNSDKKIAAIALGFIGSESKNAVPDIIELLRNRPVFVRYSAAKALGLIGDARAISALEAATNDEDDYVRRIVKAALKRLRSSIQKPVEGS